ncbi:MAG: CPBP family intramembrane metalloprotease [Promethearchaeota archaeon]|nr:MAG: CPBP family intramembrane metalloprotease [Candidatus Lokiarchaeota archaeon]
MVDISGFLRRHSFIGSLVVMALFGLLLYLGSYLLVPLILISLSPISFGLALWLNFLIVFGLLALLFLVVIPLLIEVPVEKDSYGDYFNAIGLRKLEPKNKILKITVISAVTFFIFGFIGSLILGQTVFNFGVLFAWPSQNNLGLFVFIFQLRPGIWEEVAFRGVILGLLLQGFGKKSSIFLSGVLFGLMHFLNLIGGASLLGTIFQVIFASFLGFLFGYIMTETKNLFPCIILHYLFNVFGNVFFQVSQGTLFGVIFGLLIIGILTPVIINMIVVKVLMKDESPQGPFD